MVWTHYQNGSELIQTNTVSDMENVTQRNKKQKIERQNNGISG